MIIDEQYGVWLSGLKERYQRCQIKASVSVNREMLMFYWSLGRDIVQMKAQSKWGDGFIRQLSNDLQRELPDAKGFSRTNLLYMTSFYQMYCDMDFVPQLEGRFLNANVPKLEGRKDLDVIPRFDALFWSRGDIIS